MLNISGATLASVCVATGLLVACGGGGSGPGAALAITGTAATGLAIAGGTISLKCVSGAGSATTAADGTFSVAVSNVTFPCLARVDYKNAKGQPKSLQTIVTGPGTANITPVSDLIVAKLTKGRARDAFDHFDAEKIKTVTPGQIKQAGDDVKIYLKAKLGLDTKNIPEDPIGTKLTAKVGASAPGGVNNNSNTNNGAGSNVNNNVNDGDSFDKNLDELQSALQEHNKDIDSVEDDMNKNE
ncbi:MAG: hypothetical protein NVS3B2_09360 [Ramlibacter sp.]